jgi:5,6-dimethylbenzimidazole synthase
MPEGARPLAILCLGAVDEFYERPMLEEQGWDERRPLSGLIWEDRWGAAPSGTWTHHLS